MKIPFLKHPSWYNKVVEVQPNQPQAEIAIVVGHHKLAKGAYSGYFKSYEWDFNKGVVEMLTSNVDIYYHNPNIRGYTARQKAMATRLNKKPYKLVMEIHFNAATPVANGVECMYYFKNNRGKKHSELFCKIIEEDFGIKNRGAKALISSKDRGYGFVYHPKATAILLEPFFGSSFKDCSKIKSDTHLAMSVDKFINKLEL